MALDEHAARLIDGLNEQGFTSLAQMSVDDVRATIATFIGLQAPPEVVAEVRDAEYVSGSTRLPLRIYIPEGSGPKPVVLYFHGGGFVAGDLTVVDEPARAIANATGAIVVTAGYRLAPEHKFPAAPDDAWAALNWVVDHIGAHGGDAANLIVMGDSAGGTLAAVTALRARDLGGPAIRAQVLIYPAIDPNIQLPSRRDFAEGHIITSADLDWFYEQYLASPGDARNPYAVPTHATHLDGLPPALILTTENEVLRDEGELFGERLRQAGVDVRVRRFDGLVHGTFWMSGAVPRCSEMREAAAEFITSITADATAG